MNKLLRGIWISLSIALFSNVMSSCAVNKSTIILTSDNEDKVKYTKAKVWESDEVNKVYYDILGEDVMPIVGFWGPFIETSFNGTKIPSLITDDIFQKIQECGVNLIWQDNFNYEKDSEEIIEYMDLCAKYGIGYVVSDPRICKFERGWDNPHEDLSIIKVDQKMFNEYISDYAFHPAFGGFSVIDEIAPSMKNTIKNVTDMYKSAEKTLNIRKTPVWHNLFPMGYVNNREGYDYYQYLRENGSMLGYISYDFYPFEWDQADDLSTGFYTNLNAVYSVAKELNIPFWAFIQMGGNWTNVWDDHIGVKPPTIEQVLWEINTYLCYGAKGFQYYTLNMPFSTFNYLDAKGELGMFDPFGNKTKYYYAVKVANEQISSCDEYFMNATHHGLISTGYIMGSDKNAIISLKDRKFRELINVSQHDPSLIGCFEYKGKTMLYLMNSSYYDDANVSLKFDNRYCYSIIQRGKEMKAVGTKLNFNLSPGEGILIRLI